MQGDVGTDFTRNAKKRRKQERNSECAKPFLHALIFMGQSISIDCEGQGFSFVQTLNVNET